MWNLGRLKAVLADAEKAMFGGPPESSATLRGLAELGSVSPDLAERASKECGRIAGHVMLALLRGGEVDVAALGRLHAALKAAPASGLAGDLIAYLVAAGELHAFITRARLGKASARDLAARRDDLAAVTARALDAAPHARSLHILHGAVLSLTDRSAASAAVARGVDRGSIGMATSLFDLGAHTFFESPASRAGVSVDVGEPVRAALAAARPAPDRLANLVWSVDVGFLEIYGPYWFNLAPYLVAEGFSLIMGVVGPEPAVGQRIAEARDLMERLARYHRLDASQASRAITFVPLPRPTGVDEVKTFYACARALMAPAVIQATGLGVMIMDADYTVHNSLGPFVQKAMKADVAVVMARGMTTLWPWRRNTAGAAWFNATPAAGGFLARMTAYIEAGLPSRPSWTLDQNALTYALETAGNERIADLAGSRPVAQDPIRSTFEKRWREAVGA